MIQFFIIIIIIIIICDITFLLHMWDFLFCLQAVNKKEYMLAANYKEEMEEWLAEIKKCMEEDQGSSGQRYVNRKRYHRWSGMEEVDVQNVFLGIMYLGYHSDFIVANAGALTGKNTYSNHEPHSR